MSTASEYLTEHETDFLEDFKQFLRIPSISALPEHAGNVRQAAEWVAERLQVAGAENVRVFPLGEQSVVYGDWLHAPGSPTVLIYGHFDVQPVDPLDLWVSPPFAPEVRDERIYARGASDMKGNVLMSIVAFQALHTVQPSLPLNLKFLFEGQEEIGSPDLPAFVAEHRDLLACDLAVSGDGTQWAEDQPALLVGLRGNCGVQIDVYGADTDVHSGFYGGLVPNPIHALATIIASMRAPDGTIVVDGFFDEVVPLSPADHEAIAQVPFDKAAYKASLGLQDLISEPGYTPLERAWARPTLEVNGIWGGFQGEGTKTVIPNEAHAKITCRLVPNQDPGRIVALLASHAERHAPSGVEVRVQPFSLVARPYVIPSDHVGNQVAGQVLTELYGRPPIITRMGASVPVCETLLSQLGAYTVTFGFGLGDERFHAPNEFLRLTSWFRGQHAWALLLQRLGEVEQIG